MGSGQDCFEFELPVIDCKGVAMVAVERYPDLLQFCTRKLRGDRDVVGTAIAVKGSALASATWDLHDDPDLAMEAIAHGAPLDIVSPRLQKNPDFVYGAVCHSGHNFIFLDKDMRADLTLASLACRRWGPALLWAHPDIQKNVHMRQAAVEVSSVEERKWLKSKLPIIDAACDETFWRFWEAQPPGEKTAVGVDVSPTICIDP